MSMFARSENSLDSAGGDARAWRLWEVELLLDNGAYKFIPCTIPWFGPLTPAANNIHVYEGF